jgi:AcrR family transcriptional regulator
VAGQQRRRGRPPEGVRERILETTLELIATDGIARLTTKELAERAGVSEASIYYHFADKTALLEGVLFEAVLKPLREFAASFPGWVEGKPVREALVGYGGALERFWRRVLPLLSAIQADADLREHFRERIAELGLGPHRGVQVVAGYLEEQQRAGRLRSDLDPRATAMSFASACFLSAYQDHMLGPAGRRKLPTVEAAIAALADLAGAG